MDILATGARALVVPFAEADESEQTLRARLLAERGLLSLVESSVEPSCFAAAIEAALGRPRPRPGAIDLGGARRSARLIDQMIRR
jgi:predicted glycosyltransferase